MTRQERLREVQRRQRETHQKLFDLQGQMIASLREVLDAVTRTQDEMSVLFRADNDLEDIASQGDEGPA